MTTAELIQQLKWNDPDGKKQVVIAAEVDIEEIATDKQKVSPILHVQSAWNSDCPAVTQITTTF